MYTYCGCMTANTTRSVVPVEGPLHSERWGSFGFRISDPSAVSGCRQAARWMLDRFQLGWVPGLVDDVQLMVSELVTNAQRYGGTAFPAGSFTLWHPNRWLVLTVHDKNPYQPIMELLGLKRASDESEGGRGLAMVKAVAAAHLGEVDCVPDGDTATPGKVMRVRMLLPDVQWPNEFRDPWRDRVTK